MPDKTIRRQKFIADFLIRCALDKMDSGVPSGELLEKVKGLLPEWHAVGEAIADELLGPA